MTVLDDLQNWSGSLPVGWRKVRNTVPNALTPGEVTTNNAITSKVGDNLRVISSHPMSGVAFTYSHSGGNKKINVPVNVTSGKAGIMIGRKDGNDVACTTETSPFLSEPTVAKFHLHNKVRNENFYLIKQWSDLPNRIGGSIAYKINEGDTPVTIKSFTPDAVCYTYNPLVTESGRILIIYLERRKGAEYHDSTSPFSHDNSLNDQDYHREVIGLVEINPINYTVLREQIIADAAINGMHNIGSQNHAGLMETLSGKLMIPIQQSVSLWDSTWTAYVNLYVANDGWNFTKIDGQHSTREINLDEVQIMEVTPGNFVMYARTEMGVFYKTTYTEGATSYPNFVPSEVVSPSNTPNIKRLPDGRHLMVWSSNKRSSIANHPRTVNVAGISSDGFATFDDIFLINFNSDGSRGAEKTSGVNDWQPFIQADGKLAFIGWHCPPPLYDVINEYIISMPLPPIRNGHSVSKLIGQEEVLTLETGNLPAGDYEIQIFGAIVANSDFQVTGSITVDEVSTPVSILNYYTAVDTQQFPIFALPDVEIDKLQVYIGGQIRCFDLVESTDENASNNYLYVGGTIKAIRITNNT